METEEIIEILSSITLPKEFYADFNMKLERKSIKKGDYFLKKGDVSKHIGFIVKGFFEGYHHRNDKIFVNWFWKESDLMVGLSSFLKQKPAYMSIKAIEDAELVLLSNEHLNFLYKKYPELNQVGRQLMENTLINMAEEAPSLRIYSARERYENLLDQHPEIFKRSSLKSIASYLGITQETLSRVRQPR